MAETTAQSYQHHRRYVPGFHYVTFGALAVTTIYWAVRTVTAFSLDHVALLVMGVAVILLFLYTRAFATRNQDRTIRLEEQVRLEKLLPPELVPRISELTTAQLVAIRFAADDEVEQLVRAVLTEELSDREEIKRRVRTWRPDYQRV